MQFEWDSDKVAKNLAKHYVSFQEAATVFSDPFSHTYDDPDHSDEGGFSLLAWLHQEDLL